MISFCFIEPKKLAAEHDVSSMVSRLYYWDPRCIPLDALQRDKALQEAVPTPYNSYTYKATNTVNRWRVTYGPIRYLPYLGSQMTESSLTNLQALK